MALDFDGTLTEIVDDPAAPGITDDRRAVLAAIPSGSRRLAIVSGRELDDVRVRVGVPSAIVIGNHGVEIEGPGIHERPEREVAGRLAGVLEEAESALEELTGAGPASRRAWIENKRWTATLHTRPREDAAFHAEAARALAVVVAGSGFELRPGKASWEIRPAGARDKGSAILAVLAAIPGADARHTLYMGDDATDEDAFRALADGVTVRVGAGDTAARYRVPDPAGAYDLLRTLFPAEAA